MDVLVGFRTLWVNFTFSRVKVCVRMVYDLFEGQVEERGGFWNDLYRVVDKVGNWYRLGELGDMNGWVGDRLRAGITGGLVFW